MRCCGKAKSVLKKGRNIIIGNVNYAMGIKYEFTDGRIRECQKCDECTWMSKTEYGLWLIKHGVKNSAVVTKLELEKLPKLLKYEQSRKRRNLFCRICKCFVPGKASVEDEECPLGNWKSRS